MLHGLKRNSKGGFEHTSANVAHVLENDPMLKGRLYYDSFAEQMLGVSPLPGGGINRKTVCLSGGTRTTMAWGFTWSGSWDSELRRYSKACCLIAWPAKPSTGDKLPERAGLGWYTPAGHLFIDYLGADDTPYTRAVTRKSFVAAVARAYDPGVKYDTMPVLSGPTGGGKSTLLDVMGGIWFTDSIKSFEGKEAAEMLQGAWLVEIAELHAFEKSGWSGSSSSSPRGVTDSGPPMDAGR